MSWYDSKPSIWKLSELLTWVDFGFVDGTDKTDVENLCSFIGAYDTCTMFPGVLPIVHGPVGCVSSYFATRVASRLQEKFRPPLAATEMEATDVVFGAIEKLENLVRLADAEFHPKLIPVLTTCVSDMINEDVPSVARRLKGRIGADVLPIKIGGISCKGFREGTDFALKALVDHVKAKSTATQRRPRSVNLFLRRVNGRLSENADVQEIQRLLAINGIEINTIVRIGTTYEELLKIPQAEANVSLCYTYGKAVMKHLSECFGQKYSTASYPLGLSATLRWVKRVTELVGAEDKLSGSPEVAALTSEVQELRAFIAKKSKLNECYIWHPGEKALALTNLARDLGQEPILAGFTYHTIKNTRETIIEMLKEGNEPRCIIRGNSKRWVQLEGEMPYEERPLFFMPKKFWLGNFPTVDVDFFREHAVGLTGLRNLIEKIRGVYNREASQNHSVFSRYVERKYENVDWNDKIPGLVRD
ncbi:MAG: hypothetical protein HYZ28_02245 [Myxococcales bacterium]|nr:hypothetical protein [Myxococcales bacterium]